MRLCLTLQSILGHHIDAGQCHWFALVSNFAYIVSAPESDLDGTGVGQLVQKLLVDVALVAFD